MSLVTYGDVDRIMESVLGFVSGFQLFYFGLACLVLSAIIKRAFYWKRDDHNPPAIIFVLGWSSFICIILGLILAAMEWIKN